AGGVAADQLAALVAGAAALADHVAAHPAGRGAAGKGTVGLGARRAHAPCPAAAARAAGGCPAGAAHGRNRPRAVAKGVRGVALEALGALEARAAAQPALDDVGLVAGGHEQAEDAETGEVGHLQNDTRAPPPASWGPTIG